MTFQMPVNDHLNITFQEPIYINVQHVRGYAFNIELPPSLLPLVKDQKELADCIQAAAMNNFKSMTNAD